MWMIIGTVTHAAHDYTNGAILGCSGGTLSAIFTGITVCLEGAHHRVVERIIEENDLSRHLIFFGI